MNEGARCKRSGAVSHERLAAVGGRLVRRSRRRARRGTQPGAAGRWLTPLSRARRPAPAHLRERTDRYATIPRKAGSRSDLSSLS